MKRIDLIDLIDKSRKYDPSSLKLREFVLNASIEKLVFLRHLP